MKKYSIICLVISSALALSACAKSQSSSPIFTNSVSAGYHQQQIYGATSPAVVQPIDTKRYSKMHITQSSYLFK